MWTATRLVQVAEKHLGEKYLNVQVPKDNPDWCGPWDCAEFVSWVAYQVTGRLYGCTDDDAAPSVADAYSGAWVRDARDGTLVPSSVDEAVCTPGVVLIRQPPTPGTMGHVALSDGYGKTVEAAGTGLGVRRGDVQGRLWHYAAKLPDVAYAATDHEEPSTVVPFCLVLKRPNMKGPLVTKVQRALAKAGFDPGDIDGAYGPHTVAAVTAFQASNRLIADGVCGPKTAGKLRVAWPE